MKSALISYTSDDEDKDDEATASAQATASHQTTANSQAIASSLATARWLISQCRSFTLAAQRTNYTVALNPKSSEGLLSPQKWIRNQ